MRIITRDEWGAREPREERRTTWSARTGFAVHHSGANPNQSVQEIQNFHMDDRGWWDVGYNFLVRPNGDIYEGRGWLGVGAHAHGHNTAYIGVCLIGNYERAKPSAAAKASLAYLYQEANRMDGNTLRIATHRQIGSTECPGDELHRWVIAHLAGHTPGKPSKPSRPPAGRPAPGPAVPFPLPAGHYFGPKDGPNTSVSGFYRRTFKGRTDREWLQEWTRQLQRRGWDARKGGRYLTRYGNDGLYGDEYAELAGAFQRDQRLNDDELIGPITWRAAYHNPVT
jgi:hypothetical protein